MGSVRKACARTRFADGKGKLGYVGCGYWK